MHYQTIKYFARLSSLKDNRLLHHAYNWEKEKIQTGEKGFMSYMTNTLNRIGMTNIWIEQLAHDNNNQLKKPSINNIQNNSKLIFLNSIKGTYSMENYLKIKDYQNRKAICKLRTSSHHLKLRQVDGQI